MFAKLTTRIALKKAGIPSNTFSSIPSFDNNTNGKSNGKEGKDGGANSQSALIPFDNPFTNITIPKSWNAWATPAPAPIEVAPKRPSAGSRAPDGRGLLRVGDGRECLVVFLRCCGCPFAEKTFLNLRTLSNKYPNLACIAVSHCDKRSTDKWLSALGGAWNIEIVIDEEREVYASWGLGLSSAYYLLNPWTQVAQRKLGNEEGIWGREVGNGGCWWVVGGAWAVDEMGVVRWGSASATADEQKDFVEGVRELSLR